jgi:hypothetical protein
MKKTSLAIALMFCFAGSCLFAADEKTAAPAEAKPAESKTKDAKKDKKESKLAGTWEGKFARPDGEEMKFTYLFKIDGEKLTGTITSPRGEREISEGKVKADEFSFSVKMGDNSIEYQGKLANDKINLKSQGPFGDREMTLTRAVNINGRWLTKFEMPEGMGDGQSIEITFTFKVESDKLTGKVASPMGELDISNGKVNGDAFSFDVELNGNAMGHECKISGDEIKMKLKSGMGEGMAPPEMTLKRAPEEKK